MKKSHDARTITMLRRVPIFSGLSEQECAGLAATAKDFECPKRTLIFPAGEKAQGMFIVMRGLVRIFQTMPDGREVVLHLIQPGQSFADAAVFQRASYPASAMTETDSHLLMLPAEPLLAQIAKQPELALRMLASLSNRLREFTRMLNEHQRGSARLKLAAWLLQQAGTERELTELRLDISRETLAGMLGMTRETLSRTFSGMQEAGILSVHGKNIAFLDVSGLERIAQGKDED